MNLSKPLLALAVALLPSCVASTEPDGPGSGGPGGPGGKGDDPTSNPSPHAAAILACQATFDGHLGDDPSLAVLTTYADCLVAANRAAAPALDALIERPLDILGAISRATRAGDTFCNLLRDAEDPDDTAGLALNHATCRIARHFDLAALLDAHVAFDGFDQPELPFPSSHFSACHDTYRDALAADDSTTAMIQASTDLATCVEGDLRDLISPTIIEGLTARGLSPASGRARFEADLTSFLTAIHGACTVFGAAGGNEGGSLERVQVAACVADGVALLGAETLDRLEIDP